MPLTGKKMQLKLFECSIICMVKLLRSDDSLGYDFPFTLRAVKADGLTCAICPWSSFCRGCEIRCNNDFVLQGALPPINAVASK